MWPRPSNLSSIKKKNFWFLFSFATRGKEKPSLREDDRVRAVRGVEGAASRKPEELQTPEAATIPSTALN